MKPNERILLSEFYQLHGRQLYSDHWNDKAIYFLNSKNPKLVGFDLSSDQIEALLSQGEHLNKMAVDNAKKVEKHFIKHLDKVFFSDNYRTSYEYHGEVLSFSFQDSICVCKDGDEHLCQITLQTSSEFVDGQSLELFDPSVSETLKKNNKAVLVSKAVLLYFDHFGIPANRKVLVAKIQDEYLRVYNESVNENLIYDAISVMSDFWNKSGRH